MKEEFGLQLIKVQEFIEYAVTPSRFSQAHIEIFGDGEPDVTKLGDFIRWVIKDILAEELDVLAKNGLEPKDVNKYVSEKVRKMFFERL